MQPNLPSVFDAWKPYLASTSREPCIVLDLSPRLTKELRDGVESIADSSGQVLNERGRGCRAAVDELDRLELWLGGVATPNISKRFVRLSRTFGGEDTSSSNTNPHNLIVMD